MNPGQYLLSKVAAKNTNTGWVWINADTKETGPVVMAKVNAKNANAIRIPTMIKYLIPNFALFLMCG